MRRFLLLIPALFLVVACGSNNPTTPTSTPTPTVTPAVAVMDMNLNTICQSATRCVVNGTVSANGYVVYMLNYRNTASTSVTLSWPSTATTLDLWLTRGLVVAGAFMNACFVADPRNWALYGCDNALASTSRTSTSVSFTRSLSGDTIVCGNTGAGFECVYQLGITNRSSSASSYTLTVTGQ